MIIKYGQRALTDLVLKQSENMYGLSSEDKDLLETAVPKALDATASCFESIRAKYYRNDDGAVLFNPYHTCQYSVFLYWLARTAWCLTPASDLANILYSLNKLLNACDIYYEVDMPAVYYMEHPVGTVLGRASYSNYLVFQQRCTVGGNRSAYPVLGEYVWLFAGASVIGDCRIGNNVFLSAECMVKDENVPDNTIVFGASPNLVLKTKEPGYFHARSPFVPHS